MIGSRKEADLGKFSYPHFFSYSRFSTLALRDAIIDRHGGQQGVAYSPVHTKSWKGCFLVVNSLFLAKNIDEAAKILEATEDLIEKSVIEKAKKEENCPNIEVRYTNTYFNVLRVIT